MLTDADVCLYFSYCEAGFERQVIHNVCGRMLTYADVCSYLNSDYEPKGTWTDEQRDVCGRMLTYVDVCCRLRAQGHLDRRATRRMRTYADVC